MNAYRGGLALLGFGLVVVWLVGLSTGQNLWLTWFDGISGACSLIAAGVGFSAARTPMRSATSWMIGLSIALFVFWVMGLVAGNLPAWLTWSTFGFAIGYLLTGIGLGTRSPRGITGGAITRPI